MAVVATTNGATILILGFWAVRNAKSSTAGYKGLLYGIRRYEGRRFSALFVYKDALIFASMPSRLRLYASHWSTVQIGLFEYQGELMRASNEVASSGSRQLARYLGGKRVPVYVVEGELSVQWEGRKLWLSVSGNPKKRITGSHRALNQLALWLRCS
jgi:hypothetical protein